MKRIFLILSILLSCFSVNAQLSDTLNQKDEKGKKQGHWIYYGADRPDLCIVDTGKVEEGNYVNDRKEGTWIKYYEDGAAKRLIGEYRRGRPAGKYEKYYFSGKLMERGTFVKNIYRDTLFQYFENGTLHYIAAYDSIGKETGIVRYFYPNGQPEFIYKRLNNHFSDSSVRFYMNGNAKSVEYYDDSDNIITIKHFDPIQPLVQFPDFSEKVIFNETPSGCQNSWQPDNHNLILNEQGLLWIDGNFQSGRLMNGKLLHYSKDGALKYVVYYMKGNAYPLKYQNR